MYSGEQPAIVDRALWERVQQQFKMDTRRRVRPRKVEALLSGLLYCAQCGERMGNSYTSRQGRRHLYYVCRTKRADAKCQ
ncbi:MAG: zinc ribbon domain-containing protein, partial [Solirubrobacterales bacterium]|nr:zinc ribbon domain-containing protein [Solirubrobacterales bacterium]